jgi:hypothetical protein
MKTMSGANRRKVFTKTSVMKTKTAILNGTMYAIKKPRKKDSDKRYS